MRKNLPKNSLRELPKDKRDFALGAIFPQVDLKEVPNKDFIVSEPLVIKNQGETDFCSGYAVTSVSEDQEGVELIPEYQFLKTKELSGDPEEWGADLRIACKSAVKFGSLSVNNDIFKFDKTLSRSQILKQSQWPEHVDRVALYHKKETFFSVDGKYDIFDNIRVALWQHKKGKSSIATGALWRSEWLEAPGGVIPEKYGKNGFGHAFKIFGQKIIEGHLYLMAQLSQGDMVGDGGIFYISRSVANKEIGKYGIFMFKDISREDAEYFLKNKISAKQSFFSQFWSLIKNFFEN